MYNKILAPLDGSELAECTLQHVKEVATGCHVSEVALLRVVEPPPMTSSGEGWAIPEDFDDKRRQDAEKYLARVAGDLKKEGLAVQTAVRSGIAAREIMDYASQNQVDLIVLSTHGSSGVTRWLLGSVADRVSRHSTVPVLMVSPPGCRVG